MIRNADGAVLVALDVLQGFDFAVAGFVGDLAVSLAGPVALGVDALLYGLALLPKQIAFRDFGQCQAVRQDLQDKWLAR